MFRDYGQTSFEPEALGLFSDKAVHLQKMYEQLPSFIQAVCASILHVLARLLPVFLNFQMLRDAKNRWLGSARAWGSQGHRGWEVGGQGPERTRIAFRPFRPGLGGLGP